AGESWLVEPVALNAERTLWTPGVRAGVARGSEYHLTEYFGPILGIMTAPDLDTAIEMQNQVEYGLTAGLHSLDTDEIVEWVGRVQAGNLYVNRGITGAIVRRQPFGGWKKSSVGAGTKAGGPNYLVGLSGWRSRPAAGDEIEPQGVLGELDRLLGTATELDAESAESLKRALRSDERAWRNEFGVARDVSQLGVERNVLRYLPVPVVIRATESAEDAEIVRILAAAARSGSPFAVSLARTPSALLSRVAQLVGTTLRTEDDTAWLDRLGREPIARIRLLGDAEARSFAGIIQATGARPDLAVYRGAVTEAGRIELLPFLHEQAVSVTAHRFGTPNGVGEAVFADVLS
ncbi:aldehyde dehydrogenase family protein, partial [Mycetocola reblochoni]